MDIQREIYGLHEKPRLQSLIKRAISEVGVNASQDLIPLMNSRLEGTGLHQWTSVQLTGLTADPKDAASSFTTKKLLRVAISLGIDPEPRWALALLYLYMLGFLELNDLDTCKELRKLLRPPGTNVAKLIESIERKSHGAITQLLINSPLTRQRLERICEGADIGDDEARWISEWAANYEILVTPNLLKLPFPDHEFSSK